jgi:hypothetical protein
MAQLIFIDTNIFLDFYRIRGQDTDLSILSHIDKNHDTIISTSQVEMEYKKNRQKAIQESLGSQKGLEPCPTPAFLRESKPRQALTAAEKQIKSQTIKLRQRTIATLENPGRNDRVYKTAQRLFRADGPCHLTREKKVRTHIRELAHKRFTLGYPPRKNGDTSIGDAINWEWIIYCAIQCEDDIIIVSRDTDYGIVLDSTAYLNDWLLQEFKQRVSRRRKLTLTTRLTEAFKLAGIKVSKKEVTQEEQLIQRVVLPVGAGKTAIPSAFLQHFTRAFMEKQQRSSDPDTDV